MGQSTPGHDPFQDGKSTKDSGVVNCKYFPALIFPGHLGSDSEFPVPQTRMVSADISEVAEKVQPGSEHRMWKAKALHNSSTRFRKQSVIEYRKRTKAHHFDCHPHRQTGESLIRRTIMLDERLPSPRNLSFERIEPPSVVEIRPHEIDRIVGEGAPPFGKSIDETRPEGDLHLGEGSEKPAPQFLVKLIESDNCVERASRRKFVSLRLKRQKISADSIVADPGQELGSFARVLDIQPANLH
jgi:hypothetical protein